MDKIIQGVHQDVKNTGCIIKSLVNELSEFTDSFNAKLASCEERSIVTFFSDLLDNLENASELIEYYSKPIRAEGRLFKKENGRYALQEDKSIEFSCGSIIEILYDRYNDSSYEWFRTRIEAKDGQYYANGYYEKFGLEGAQVRIR